MQGLVASLAVNDCCHRMRKPFAAPGDDCMYCHSVHCLNWHLSFYRALRRNWRRSESTISRRRCVADGPFAKYAREKVNCSREIAREKRHDDCENCSRKRHIDCEICSRGEVESDHKTLRPDWSGTSNWSGTGTVASSPLASRCPAVLR